MRRKYQKWYSGHLHRDMELLVFGDRGARVLVFPTRSGRFYDYEDWGFVSTLERHIEEGWLQLICIDSVDSDGLYCFYCDPRDRILRHSQYECYILNEVLPFSLEHNPGSFLIAHGCSLGAYHAVNIAFRNPHLFGKVVALSGRYDLTCQIGPFIGLFDGYYDDTIYFHTPSHFVPNLHDPWRIEMLRKMEIIMVCGNEDAFLENNRQLSSALWGKGIWHALHTWDGEAHRPRYWRQMAKMFL